jgi:predicted ATPase/DNA-binding SARP family transcriptional activator
MEIRLLGSIEIVDGSGARIPVQGTRLQALIAALALQAGSVVSVDRLLDALWSDAPPDGATNALQRHVSSLRKVIGPGAVRRHGDGYVLDVDASSVDARAFEDLDRRGRAVLGAGDVAQARAYFAQALDLWRGDALSDLGESEFFRADITRLTEARLAALEARLDADLALGEHASLVAELERLAAEHPLREHFRAQLMLALARAGRQADALREYQTARTVLIEELGLEPSAELRALEASILDQDDSVAGARAPVGSRRRTNLPAALTAIVGRAGEVEGLQRVLEDARLTTIVGPGGAGKTRLALEVAREWFARGSDETWLVELAGVRDPDAVAPTIGAALELSEAADPASITRITQFLGRAPALLVLDNCEHLIDRVATIARELLAACPTLRILATSREPLGITGEVVRPIPALGTADAVSLFVERARAVAPRMYDGDSPSAADRDAIEQVCQALDCLPLAIELAAARVPTMHIDVLVQELDNRYRVLTRGGRTAPPRQRTLRATVDWSYDLLFDDERRVFERLAVFVGGWSLDAARAVCSDDVMTPDDVDEVLGRLVDKSLVVTKFDGKTTRYDMLQTLLEYSRERLASSEDAPRVADKHRAFFAELCAGGVAAQRGDPQREWLRTVNADGDNIRAALSALLERDRDAEVAETATGALGWYWWLAGRSTEGARWIAASMAHSDAVPPLVRARALSWNVYLGRADATGDTSSTDDVEPTVEEAIRLFREAGAIEELAEAISILSIMYSTRGDKPRMQRLVLEAERLLDESSSSPRVVAMHAWVAARRALYEGRNLDAEQGFLRANDLLRDVGDDALRTFNSMYLGRLALLRGDSDTSVNVLEAGLAATRDLGLLGLADLLTTDLGDALAVRGDVERARELLTDARRAGRDLMFLPGYGRPLIALALLEQREGNDEAARAAAEEALELVLAGDNRDGIAHCFAILGSIAERRDDTKRARELHLRAFGYAAETNEPRALALACSGLASVAGREGNAAESARLLGVADAVRRSVTWRTGWSVASAEKGDAERIEHAARRQLGPAAFDAAYADGAAHAWDVVDELRRAAR